MPKTAHDISETTAEAAQTRSLALHDPQQTLSITGIRVFDVGQGDCVGLLNQSSAVFCYVDYGGLANHPDASNPSHTAKRLPVQIGTRPVAIVLTHWDKDHYYSAVKKNTAAQACDWVIPRQWVSPQAVRFAAKLKNAQCWPQTQGQKPAPFPIGTNYEIEIRKCQPFERHAVRENRNETGLVVTVEQSSNGSLECYMLLPGDCHYDAIPAPLPAAPIRVLMAYHHGSRTHWDPNLTLQALGQPAGSHDVVYSYGQSNWTVYSMNYQPTWDPPALQHAAHSFEAEGA